MKTIESYLPLFPGFYNTYFEYDNESDDCEEEGVLYEDIEWDYEGYRNNVAKGCVSSVSSFLPEKWKIKIEFEKVYSPKFYNFDTDVIYCTYIISDESFNELIEYCKDNKDEFKLFLEDKYSSREGFVSFFKIKPKKWFNKYLVEGNKKFEKAFAGVMEFYLVNEGYTVYDMYEDTNEERSYIDYTVKIGEEE